MISVVIPIFCEGSHLAGSLNIIRGQLQTTKLPYEICLIDDGSSDNSWSVILSLTEQWSELRAVRLSRNFGKEAAICAGLDFASGQAVIVMDADLQHPPTLIPEMVRLWKEEGFEIVEGVKQERAPESWINRQGAKLFYNLLNFLSGSNLSGASDFKLLDGKVIAAWRHLGERNTFFRGLISWMGYKRITLPFRVNQRTEGRSQWTFLRLVRLALNGLTAFTTFPLHIVTFMGLVFLVFAVLLGAQTLYVYVSGHAVSGFTTVILLILLTGSALMLSLGVIGEYMARIYEEVKRRPRYLVAERAGTKNESFLAH